MNMTDTICTQCGTEAQERKCAACGTTAMITDCGHMAQPRPIAAGRIDGTDLQNDYCDSCAAATTSDDDEPDAPSADDLAALRDEAAQAGDMAQVDMCDRAEEGDDPRIY